MIIFFLKLRCGGVLHFPESSFNSYSIKNKPSDDSLFLRLELIPEGKMQKAEVQILINKG